MERFFYFILILGIREIRTYTLLLFESRDYWYNS